MRFLRRRWASERHHEVTDDDIVKARAGLEADRAKTQQVRDRGKEVDRIVANARQHNVHNGFAELFSRGLKGT